MATSVHIPLGEYLKTTYRPDRDYVDGELQERNLGQRRFNENAGPWSRANHRQVRNTDPCVCDPDAQFRGASDIPVEAVIMEDGC
jgi:hypothetical protein